MNNLIKRLKTEENIFSIGRLAGSDTHNTLTDALKCIEAAFESWLQRLDAEFKRHDWGDNYATKTTTAECWLDMFAEGVSPQEACSEEMSCATP